MTEVEEKNMLPGHSNIQLEKDKIELIGGIQNFNTESPSLVRMKELVGGTELVRQERGHQAVHREIAEEREKVKHLTGVEGFNNEGLPKVRTLEPLSGAELLQRELTQKAVTEELGAFNRSGMKPIVVEERMVRPDTAIRRE